MTPRHGGQSSGKGWNVVVEASSSDVEPVWPDAASDRQDFTTDRQEAITDQQAVSQPPEKRPKFLRRSRQDQTPPRKQREPRKKRRGAASVILRGLMRMWIPLAVLAVISAGGLAVSRLHGEFGSDKPATYGDTRTDAAKPYNPKHMKYEIFGTPGTVAQISYFDENGDPKFIEGVALPWSLDFPISAAAGIGSIAAQGDSDSIGCRILVDGEVKSEKTATHEASTFVSCMLKSA